MGPSTQGVNRFFSDALPCMRRCSWWVPAVRGANHFFCPDALPCMRRCSWWVPTVGGRIVFFRTHFLACEDVAGGSQQSGGRIVFFRTHFLVCEDVAGGSQQSGENAFFMKYGGPSGGSSLSDGGIIILRVIRRHFLAAAVDPAVSLSTYSPRPMEAIP